MKALLIDSHAHLTDDLYNPSSATFGGISTTDIISSMNANGLKNILTVSYDIDSAKKSRIIAESNKPIYFAAGVHPSESGRVEKNYLDDLRLLLKSDKCVAMGEIGLDYHYEDTCVSSQKKVLNEQLDLLGESGLPVIFHVRDAYGDMLEIIKNNLHKMPKRGVMHCFSGSKETALTYIDMGFYISFSGSITFKNAVKFPEIIAALPQDRVLIETDCPYLTPMPYRGKPNYPSYVKYQADKIASVWGKTYEEVACLTAQNTQRLFGIKD